MKRALLIAAMTLLSAQAVPALAADGPAVEHKARQEQWCKDNPDKCREMQARREQCKANPEKCRAEQQARRERWCKDNPERCQQMKTRMEERRKQCEAQPDQCPPARRPGRGT
jgi:hypothetical protein